MLACHLSCIYNYPSQPATIAPHDNLLVPVHRNKPLRAPARKGYSKVLGAVLQPKYGWDDALGKNLDLGETHTVPNLQNSQSSQEDI